MNRKAILKTAICRYDAKGKEYVVESPLLEICHGIADTEAEAWDIFNDLLNAMYIEYLEGKGVGQFKRGRPAKGRIEFHAQVKPDTKERINSLAAKMGISQGEALDYLVFAHKCSLQAKKPAPQARARRIAG